MKKIKKFFRWYFKAQGELYAQCMRYGVNPFI